ncbi:MAG: iron ABC transporter substrate-binding protein [Candidatus Wallbacteria bacterium HGW-Wallbacteria-1]|uniref:Iron ABC transporter substrate-binding protein n=1 Tax=Candidatus Wallbacteria bacterium HGW-Wallbacteria-1 TaxID=2013854 RepID=A0A2N1PPU5_9BACT|nr:MAG: iron ABC transporter substrate-binding protein [Candidatus Wallbacteria bacterium HGW-Wallbacteria-1]
MTTSFALAVPFTSPASSGNPGEVIVYTSLDRVFSEPVFNLFEQRTGIRVKALYDVEATKTTGLVNRLIAEAKHPRADVFWNSEVGRTIQLAGFGILTPYESPYWKNVPNGFKDPEFLWTGLAARARVLIYNRKMLSPNQIPESIMDLLKPEWKGRVAIGYPLFGTTATHVAALYACLGKNGAQKYLRALSDNEIRVVDGNAVTRDMVVAGEIPLAFTDTDDANVAIQRGADIGIIYPDRNGIGTLLIPNTVSMIRNGPNPEQARKLIDFILSSEVEKMLAFGESAQMPLKEGVPRPEHIPPFSAIRAMKVDYENLSRYLEESAIFCRDLFIR